MRPLTGSHRYTTLADTTSYIDAYKDQFGVEAICRVIKQADRGFITSRGYRKATTRVPSARTLSDALLIPEIQRVHAENFSVYGIRKMWHAMNREGFHIGRDKTARLMKLAGVSGREGVLPSIAAERQA